MWGLLWVAVVGVAGAQRRFPALEALWALERIRELGAPQEVRVGLAVWAARRVVAARQVAGAGEVVVVRWAGLLR